MKRRKKNPNTINAGRFYNIYIAPFRQHYRKNEKLVWEGYGVDDPWEVFREFIETHPNECVTLYVLESHSNLLNELAQYWDGEIEYR